MTQREHRAIEICIRRLFEEHLARIKKQLEEDFVSKADFEKLTATVEDYADMYKLFQRIRTTLVWVGFVTLANMIFTTKWQATAEAVWKLMGR